MIGKEMLLTMGCGAIIEDEKGGILIQKRTGSSECGIPGGLLELGETFEETVQREVWKETGVALNKIQLFGIYSGEQGFAPCENGEQGFSVQIILRSVQWKYQ